MHRRAATSMAGKKSKYQSNNALTLRNSAPKSVHIVNNATNCKQIEDFLPIKRPSSLRFNTSNTDVNRSSLFSFPLPFSTTTASTPCPPPLSTSFHHNINNDIVISMDKDTNISSSIKTKDEAIECP
eukprot:743895_1